MMTTDLELRLPISAAIIDHRRPWAATLTSYEHGLAELRRSETAMRAVLSHEGAVLHEKEELIQLLEILSKESDHRFLNSLQMIAGLLSMQARTAVSPETAGQLAIAADRVIMIGAIHRRLHCLDGTRTVAFKRYLADLCGDFTKMQGAKDGSETIVRVDAIEAELPSTTAIPLGFIASELITNAVKYGKGQIKVQLGPNGDTGYALSISNDGPSLPSGFDPAKSKGVGMKVIRSLVAKIGGELQFGPGDQGEGARFTVLFG